MSFTSWEPTTIGIVSLPPISCVPLERTVNVAALGQCREEINDAAIDFTVKQGQLVATLNSELPGSTLVLGNVFDLSIDVISNPSAYGDNAGLQIFLIN